LCFIQDNEKEEWLELIKLVQNEIEIISGNPYYAKAYKQEEIFYWSPVAKWIYDEKNVETVLDIGCAYGTLAIYVKKLFNAEIYATDYLKIISDDILRKFNIIYEVNNIELDVFPWNMKFDLILLTEVFEHLNFHGLFTLKKIQGLLTEKGSLYLTTPDAKVWGKLTDYYNHYNDMPYSRT
jgi:2-polyprenyl-3-methyl-5-hydroxy-6-metoxy-1,4-benzoquinol methylase